ncbi:helix-turn-helix domain-containing protein [Streptomyces sp. SCUT-3]|uniref:helix-turn-helix domain-containing protein n=1 Tax=Streptomyces sp. SCUT-3 TaxID=2684469 RepID=UPI000CC0B3F2|nr:helix-turn-helix transcriptional regulator [Streptomyces sp. SCUT-3]PLW74271.1 XRE family transcriptional regulator [Streptomyces sp. DJ]QMV21782.1 helix-turn-helix domain-containing protein [Streptomyces sp. SCUT-3]
MSRKSGPAVNRRQLGAELRRLREKAGLRSEAVARELGCSMTRISRIETGKGGAVAKPDDVRRLCALYGVTAEHQVEMLLDMLAGSQQPGWWESYGDVLPSGLEVYVGLETDALAEKAWEPLLVHGLLQTPEYARAVIESWNDHRPSDIDALVELRTQRQEVLFRTADPLELWIVLDEAAVRRPIGGASVMREQLLRVVEVSALPNVTVQVLPYAKGGHPGLGGAFSLMEFEADDPVVYVESQAGNLYLQKRPEVRRFVSTLDLLRAMALAPDDTRALLRDAAEEMR